jgi:hypothetical protein
MPTLNYAKETTTTTGTGTYSLAGAASPFASFVARATDDVGGSSPWSNIFYVCTDNAGTFEFGQGTLTDAGTDTLTRGTIHASSNGGAAVNWGAGTKDIYSWPPGDQLTGAMIQHVYALTTTTHSVTTATPAEDGSVPLITEGAQIQTISYTPIRTDTQTSITYSCPYVELTGTGPEGKFTLWYDTTLLTTVHLGGNVPITINSVFNHSATTAITIQVRAGVTSGDTMYLNRSASSATPYGAGGLRMMLAAREVT